MIVTAAQAAAASEDELREAIALLSAELDGHADQAGAGPPPPKPPDRRRAPGSGRVLPPGAREVRQVPAVREGPGSSPVLVLVRATRWPPGQPLHRPGSCGQSTPRASRARRGSRPEASV